MQRLGIALNSSPSPLVPLVDSSRIGPFLSCLVALVPTQASTPLVRIPALAPAGLLQPSDPWQPERFSLTHCHTLTITQPPTPPSFLALITAAPLSCSRFPRHPSSSGPWAFEYIAPPVWEALSTPTIWAANVLLTEYPRTPLHLPALLAVRLATR